MKRIDQKYVQSYKFFLNIWVCFYSFYLFMVEIANNRLKLAVGEGKSGMQ